MPELYNRIKKYKSEYDYSYTLGMFPTVELLKNRKSAVKVLYAHSKLAEKELFEEFDKIIITDDKTFARVGAADNSYIMGVFNKYECVLDKNHPHIVLVNPGDMGNLGTIVRTIIGFGYKNLAIIKPAADIFDPKSVRASMGALFRINFQYYNSFNDYTKSFPQHKYFPFLTQAEDILSSENCPQSKLFSLVFGNESTGLDIDFLDKGEALKILQTSGIDSLNLAVAVAIGSYIFAVKNLLITDAR